MQLSTLIEVQRLFEVLRLAERDRTRLSGSEYMACLLASSHFAAELADELKKHDVAVSMAQASMPTPSMAESFWSGMVPAAQ